MFGQPFSRGAGRFEAQIVVNDGVGHLMGQDALMNVFAIQVNRIGFINIPCTGQGALQRTLILVTPQWARAN